ncbi:axonemal dynein light intermediate polypeptide 1 isoform X1 [Callorhinchus milii]|uniref:Axonemal dynein light intermediate polypeptide 1 n=1 Tax=Callorhinchus milii TaxID=7868 RepID=A0A4W3IPL4_CALMI|nr:axonemal dynein light intermediate polypeptide 1 isoform X1 [Callorhinchus milii]
MTTFTIKEIRFWMGFQIKEGGSKVEGFGEQVPENRGVSAESLLAGVGEEWMRTCRILSWQWMMDEWDHSRLLKWSGGTRLEAFEGKNKDLKKQRQSQTHYAVALDQALGFVLCCREWAENGQLWVQQVSSNPCTRIDVVHLQEQLDLKLQQRQARETGICPVRRELYSQCFDELIRQVTINCAERGLLLLRVRDEIRMTISAYQTLYESSVAFGMRKALQAEEGKADMEKKIADLEVEKKELERQVNEQKAKCEGIEKRENERRQVDDKKHAEEIQFLKRTNQQLKVQLEGIITPKK